MKKIIFILTSVFLVNCSTMKSVNQKKSLTPTKFVFNKYNTLTRSGMDELYNLKDSIADLEYDPKGKDSITNQYIKNTPLFNIPLDSNKIHIYVDIEGDSIWRYSKKEGKMIGDYLMIKKGNGNLNYYDKSKKVNYRKYDLFGKNETYKIVRKENDRKNIMGYECFKLELTKIKKDSEFGNTLYEMYVTDKIKLPIHSVINLTKLIPDLFPLEIRLRPEKVLTQMEVVYELIEIK